jgi:hypothetical protein
MKRLALAVASLLSLAAAFPERGKDFYVAATLKLPRNPVYVLAPCEPLTATRINAEKMTVWSYDGLSNMHWFKGEWSFFMYATADECRAAINKNGEPDVRFQNGYHVLGAH